jgi:hypothetical protein
MQGKYFISKALDIVRDGKPTRAMAQWMDRMSAIAEGISSFIGENGDGELTADDVAQGVTNRVIELANQAIARNTDGTIASITYTDPDTSETILTELFTYNSVGQIEQVEGTDANGQVTTENFTFNADFLSTVTVSVGTL